MNIDLEHPADSALEGGNIPAAPLLKAWLQVGAQSFGGGMSTMTLIQSVFVRQYGWITDAEFVHNNALSQMAPGINLLAITILIGRRLGGAMGVGVSLLGLLAPSAAITILMTAGYAEIRHIPTVQAALHGVVPATVGIGLLTAWSLAKAMINEAKARDSSAEIAASAAILVLSGLMIALHVAVIAVLFIGGVLMAVLRTLQSRPGVEPLTNADEAALLAESEAEESR